MRAPPAFRAQAGGLATFRWCHEDSLKLTASVDAQRGNFYIQIGRASGYLAPAEARTQSPMRPAVTAPSRSRAATPQTDCAMRCAGRTRARHMTIANRRAGFACEKKSMMEADDA